MSKGLWKVFERYFHVTIFFLGPGIIKDIVDILAKSYNFTVRSDIGPNNSWGSFIGGDSPWGAMDAIMEGEYDVSFAPWSQTVERLPFFDFSALFSTKRRLTLNFQAISSFKISFSFALYSGNLIEFSSFKPHQPT